MMRLPPLERAARLRNDERGSVLIEFALLAPVFLTLLIGVVQVGLHMQNANAVRNLASDGARFAVVQYQRERNSPTEVIETWIRSEGVGGKYNLATDRLGVTVTEESTSRIAGAIEMEIRVTYSAPDFLAFVPAEVLQLQYVRPVFLLSPT
jgi:Flp pilus assembly pilin Flp